MSGNLKLLECALRPQNGERYMTMRIAHVTVENYKIFKGKHYFDFNENLIFLVGENNTGKSTLFEAVNFLKSGLPAKKNISDVKNKFSKDNEHVVCTLKFKGGIKEVINDFSEAKYEKYVDEEDGWEVLTIQRSTEERTVKQNGKDIKLNVKKITVWNPTTSQFENVSGIDNVISTLFEAQFVWADTDPSDVSDFGSTKVCGRLLSEAVGDFFEGAQWKKFTAIHKETFHGDGDSLCRRTEVVEQNIKSIMETQYGRADVKFTFALPETTTFYKAGEITVNDGVDTKLEEKGTGMQRAVALAMIQVYSQNIVAHPDNAEKTKPLFFFIDEPEICLHPKAQHQLINALASISKLRQIFISTHSPYLLKSFESASHRLLMFKKKGESVEVTPAAQLNLFTWSPSMGEINYSAYNLCTWEFHNELYGYLQEKEKLYKEKELEDYFVSSDVKKNKKWIRVKDGVNLAPYDMTLMTYIRNAIHHPENKENESFTDEELRMSIEQMIDLVRRKVPYAKGAS